MKTVDGEANQQRVARGFVPLVIGEDVHVEQGGGLVFLAKRNLTIQQGGGQWLVCGGDLSVRQGGCAAMVAKRAWVESGFVATLIAGSVDLAPGARVLLRATPAAAVSAAAGFVAGWLLGRRKSSA